MNCRIPAESPVIYPGRKFREREKVSAAEKSYKKPAGPVQKEEKIRCRKIEYWKIGKTYAQSHKKDGKKKKAQPPGDNRTPRTSS